MGRNTFYSFGTDLAARDDVTVGQQLHWVKRRTDHQEERKLVFRGLQDRSDDILRGRTKLMAAIDDGNFSFMITGAQTGRMSSEHPNLSSAPRKMFVFEPEVDADAMNLICAKVGETTSANDPYLELKHRERSYGYKSNLAYA